MIIISLDSESGRKPRVKKEDIQVKLEGLKTTKAKGKVRNQAIPAPLPGLKVAFDHGLFIQESQTAWTYLEITSFLIEDDLQVMAELWVKWIEYLLEIPYIFPIPKVPTVFIVNLQDEKSLFPKYEGDPMPLRPDVLIKSKVCLNLLPELLAPNNHVKISEPGQLEGWEQRLRFNCPCEFSIRISMYCVLLVLASLSRLLCLHGGWPRASQGHP